MRPANRPDRRRTVLAICRRSVLALTTNPALLVPALLFPLLFFAAFAGGLSRLAEAPMFSYAPGYTTFEFAFVLLQTAAFTGVLVGAELAHDLESGFARRLLLAAPSHASVLSGYACSAVVRLLISGTVLTAVALAAGAAIAWSPADLAGAAALAILVNLAAVAFGTGVALHLPIASAGPLMQAPVLVVLFLAPVYVPLGLLEGWVHAVATWNPMTAVLGAVRDSFAGDGGDLVPVAAIGAAAVAALALWSWRGLARLDD